MLGYLLLSWDWCNSKSPRIFSHCNEKREHEKYEMASPLKEEKEAKKLIFLWKKRCLQKDMKDNYE